jgi:transcriptional regulator GlxA family with amidase domain
MVAPTAPLPEPTAVEKPAAVETPPPPPTTVLDSTVYPPPSVTPPGKPETTTSTTQASGTRLANTEPAPPAIEWSWARLRRSHGRASITGLAEELGWTHRRLIARFREQIGLPPKALARVIRFTRAVELLGGPRAGLAAVAYDCGYFDQAHMNRDFRELAGTTPATLVARRTDGGGVAA